MVMHQEVVSKLKRSCLSGEINPSLVELKYLKHLDLSLNCFGGIGIPNFIGSFNQLRYLNLSSAGFGGRVPHDLGNLTSLRYLDLNHKMSLTVYVSDDVYCRVFMTDYNLHVTSLHWLSHLSSLQHLDMAGVNLSMATDWLLSINMLPSVVYLRLRDCSLVSIPVSLPHVNFTSLSTLDLSFNMLGPKIPTWLFNVSKMMSLKFSSNYFGDFVPTALGNLCKLQTLELWSNSFTGEINKFKESLMGCIRNSLEELDLGSNELNGHLPDWLGRFLI
ncbi:leucine-rich repeat receptor protein kinase MSP1-like protein [Cinnamomum micranthum f. kanehirae]|uniref:Leucine-rich repeat receptor protein kinase MSP1-like protein n=1 Tax=Cinnamomum micranthum f. kanehirae TaxID=337451 RepID=A0A443PB19_9MAGN|nr:leucine-rich repeat receptor protein kinase MSP1-like protein [Cinnamomum micranthum f. kanehirae]